MITIEKKRKRSDRGATHKVARSPFLSIMRIRVIHWTSFFLVEPSALLILSCGR
nr:MAG TPA: hypothetical protein [Caudoviricetes sp.]